MRALLGWLLGEAKHCSMAAIPSLAEEDAKRPSREHEKLGADRSRIVNKMKAALIRLGIRSVEADLAVDLLDAGIPTMEPGQGRPFGPSRSDQGP